MTSKLCSLFNCAMRFHVSMYFILLCVQLLIHVRFAESIGTIVYAVNCGGQEVRGSNGIVYQADPLEGITGVSSDHGARFMFLTVPSEDAPLYQTERYAPDTFSYTVKGISPNKNHDYVLVLKFSEVYFNGPRQKVFDVVVNEEFIAVADLDIWSRVGRGAAVDVAVPFSVQDGELSMVDAVTGTKSVGDFNGALTISFVRKPGFDNPKVNAFYVMRGTMDDIPELPATPDDEEEEEPEERLKRDVDEEEEDVPEEKPRKKERAQGGEGVDNMWDARDEDKNIKGDKSKFASGPKRTSPYEYQDQTSMLMPVLVAIAAVVPVMLCLCKL